MRVLGAHCHRRHRGQASSAPTSLDRHRQVDIRVSPYRPPHPCSTACCPELTHTRFCGIHTKDQERRERKRRGTTAERGYGAAHKRWRKAILRRDPVCVTCEGMGRTVVATVADHIVPMSAGGSRLLMSNGQGLCKTCHDQKTLSEGSFGRAYIPTSPAIGERLTIVCGPPRAGKNTYVEEHMMPGDIVVDLDEIRSRKAGMGLTEAFKNRDAMLSYAEQDTVGVWLIIGAPLQSQRQAMREGLRPGRIVVLETSPTLCTRRARHDHRDLGVAIERWWSQYTRDERDEMIREEVGWT